MVPVLANVVYLKTLQSTWKAPLQMGSQVLIGDHERVVISVSKDGVTARSMATGQVIWKRVGLEPPAAISEDRLYAFSPKNNLTQYDVRTGNQLWETRPFTEDRGSSNIRKSIGANQYAVVVGIDPVRQDDEAKSTTLEFNVLNGELRWMRRGDPGCSREFSFQRNLLLSSFESFGEPGVETVDLLDRRSGSRRASITGALYVDSVGSELWFSDVSTKFIDKYAPARFTRYSSTNGTFLGEYVYAPEPGKHAAKYTGVTSSLAFGLPVPTVLTATSVFLQVGRDLYRYDRNRSPILQNPAAQPITGTLIAVIGNSPLTVDPEELTILTSQNSKSYVIRKLALSRLDDERYGVKQLFSPEFGAGARLLASSEKAAYLDLGVYVGVSFGLLVVLQNGSVAAPMPRLCPEVQSFNLLQSGSFVVACSSGDVALFSRP
jgi:outer membrane protein assembly factor BamB